MGVSGPDLLGAQQTFDIPVSEIGPLLVLKLNAFAGRQQGKDAYDILLSTLNYMDGTQAAIEGFKAEGKAGNRAFRVAIECLKRHFSAPEQSGPIRGANFATELSISEDTARLRKSRAQLIVTAGLSLLG